MSFNKEKMNIRVDKFKELDEKLKELICNFVAENLVTPMELYILTAKISHISLEAAWDDESWDYGMVETK